MPNDGAASFGARRRARRAEDAAALRAAHALRDGARVDGDSAGAVVVGSVVDRASYPVTVVPSNDRAVTPLPRARMRAFRDHLRRALAEALATPVAASLPVVPTPSDALGTEPAGCATCRGHCCTHGGDRAFLSAATLRRHLGTHPEQTPRDVRRAYLARLGGRTYEGSCVFHARDGCALPHALRSDTCNRYVCGALATHRRSGATRAFFAAARAGTVTRTAFVEAEQTPIAVTPAEAGAQRRSHGA